MRILLILITLLTWNNSLGQSSMQKLPQPTQELIQDERIDEKGFAYLEGNFKKIGDKKIIENFDGCKENCACSWSQQFSNRITYTYDNCDESGFMVKIIFTGQKAIEVFKLVDTLFHTDSNSWNKAKTVYKPKTEAAGCYFEIKQEKGYILLEYVCSC